jgi:hypothetical protein
MTGVKERVSVFKGVIIDKTEGDKADKTYECELDDGIFEYGPDCVPYTACLKSQVLGLKSIQSAGAYRAWTGYLQRPFRPARTPMNSVTNRRPISIISSPFQKSEISCQANASELSHRWE